MGTGKVNIYISDLPDTGKGNVQPDPDLAEY